MKISKEARKLSRELFAASLTDGRIDAAKVSKVVKLVAEKKPRHYLDVLKDFQRNVRLELAKRHAVIESAIALDGKASEGVANTLRAKYGNDLTTEFKTSPELIGGLRIRIGSDVYDASVQSRLERLKQELLTA